MEQTRRRAIGSAVFTLFVFLSLTTPSWRYGPFSWWPIWRVENLAGGPVQFGVLNLLPALLTVFWLLGGIRKKRPAYLGTAFAIPFAAFTAWALLRLFPAPGRLIFIYLGAFALAWLIFLFVVSVRPPLVPLLALVIVGQSLVAIGQFLRQGDLGLVLLGELPLNPAFRGVTVLYARQQPWLRAYGLTAHPNLLGAMLAMAIMLILPALSRSRAWERRILLATITIGLMGLFVTFSRAAWLGFGLGLVAWFLFQEQPLSAFKDRWRLVPFVLPLLALILVLLNYGDLVLSRMTGLEQPLEARSISQRLHDAGVAVEIFAHYPFFGSGLGSFVETAELLGREARRVHNVFLLTAAELGAVGLGLSAWLLIGPLLSLWRICRANRQQACAAAISPWVVLLAVNQLDTMLWVTSNWQTAILFALAAGTYVKYHQQITAGEL